MTFNYFVSIIKNSFASKNLTLRKKYPKHMCMYIYTKILLNISLRRSNFSTSCLETTATI